MNNEAITTEFVGLVRSFCHFAELRTHDIDRGPLRILEIVSALYASALSLPKEYNLIYQGPNVSEEIGDAVFRRLGFLPFNYYRKFLEPDKIEQDQFGIGDLADDLRDIYVDLKSGLYYYDAGNVDQAIYEWHTSFQLHWGQHAVDAIGVLHAHRGDWHR